MKASTHPSSVRTWLQLFRAPNLFTVPGDPLVGYLAASAGRLDHRLAVAIFASLCLYGAGLLLNDLADEEEDRRERPHRPLPSGAAQRGAVWGVAFLLSGAALGALALFTTPSALATGAAVLVAVALYNFRYKHWPVAGALVMGLCRSLSVIIGAAAADGFDGKGIQLALTPAIFIGLYIAAVTHLARYETGSRVPVHARLLPALFGAACGVTGTLFVMADYSRGKGIIFLLAAFAIWSLTVKMFARQRPPLPPLIGAHIRVLLPLQAAICYSETPWSFGQATAIVLLALWPISRLVSRRFYAS